MNVINWIKSKIPFGGFRMDHPSIEIVSGEKQTGKTAKTVEVMLMRHEDYDKHTLFVITSPVDTMQDYIKRVAKFLDLEYDFIDVMSVEMFKSAINSPDWDRSKYSYIYFDDFEAVASKLFNMDNLKVVNLTGEFITMLIGNCSEASSRGKVK